MFHFRDRFSKNWAKECDFYFGRYSIFYDLINIVFVRDGDVNPGKVDLKELCEEVCTEFDLKLKSFQVEKSFRQKGEFYSHPRFLRSIFRNVLQNAINYNDSKEPEIRMSMESDSRGARQTDNVLLNAAPENQCCLSWVATVRS